MTRISYQTKAAIAFMVVIIASMVTIISGLFFAPAANADVLVCPYLDAHPSVAGVEDLAGIGITVNGWTPEMVGEFIWSEVNNNCPRHLLTLQAFALKWGHSNSMPV